VPGGASESLDTTEGYLFVRATVDGKPAVFVVDTGASITALTQLGAAKLGVTASGREVVNGGTVATSVVRSLSIAGVDYANVRVAIVNVPAARRLGSRIDGILGLDVLTRSDVVIDLARDTLHLHPAGTIARNANGMVRVPFRPSPHGLIVFDVKMRKTAMPALLDTGSPITYVNEPAAPGRRSLRISKLRVADTTLYGSSYFMLVQNLTAFAGQGLDGARPAMLLGADFFDNRILAISYRDRVAFISR
jgi:hypothetical protein